MPAKDEKPMVPCTFDWQSDSNGIYNTEGPKANFIADGKTYHRPVVAATSFAPNTGKHLYEIVVNCDNMRLGLATDDADLSGEMGVANGLYSLDLQTGSCKVNGEEKKKLWRLIVSVSGGRFTFCWDSDVGVLQVWFNGEFAGTCFHKDFGLQGKTVRPIGGIMGIEANNRDIGTGQKTLVVQQPLTMPKAVLSQ